MIMRKKRVIEEIFCDICKKSFAHMKCKICGKDVCQDCARYLCKYNPRPTPPVSSSFGISSDYTAGYHHQDYAPVLNETLCTDCCEAFKMTIAVTAGQDKIDPRIVKDEIEKTQAKKRPEKSSIYS